MRIELAERMVQFPQHLADKLTHLAEWMVRGNALLRPDIREHSALIEKSSAHRKSSRRISGKSESPHVRSGEVFQQTARATVRRGLAARNQTRWLSRHRPQGG